MQVCQRKLPGPVCFKQEQSQAQRRSAPAAVTDAPEAAKQAIPQVQPAHKLEQARTEEAESLVWPLRSKGLCERLPAWFLTTVLQCRQKMCSRGPSSGIQLRLQATWTLSGLLQPSC